MPLPRRSEIFQRAKQISMSRQVTRGLPDITPTEEEMKESGAYGEAKLDLMRVDQEILAQQRRYLDEMAEEMGLEIISKRELRQLRKPQKIKKSFDVIVGGTVRSGAVFSKVKEAKKQIKKLRKKHPTLRSMSIVEKGKTIEVFKETKKVPSIAKIIMPKAKKRKKKRRKLHTSRSGKTMRALRNVKGVNVFSFPDHIWKVRTKKRRKRK